MEIKRNFNIDVKKTVENSVCGRDEFHFFVDELTSDDVMPTYSGTADEKYSFDAMDDEFFEFLNKKANGDGIYIRLAYASAREENGEAVFDIEYGESSEEFRTSDVDDVLVFEFADFGVRVRGDEITFGATVDGGCAHSTYFAEFGSSRANEAFISAENPFNRRVMEIMEGMIK